MKKIFLIEEMSGIYTFFQSHIEKILFIILKNKVF